MGEIIKTYKVAVRLSEQKSALGREALNGRVMSKLILKICVGGVRFN